MGVGTLTDDVSSPVRVTQTAPPLGHQRVASLMSRWWDPLICRSIASLGISGPGSTTPGLSAPFWVKHHTPTTPLRLSARSASLRSRTGSTGSLHCWGRFMGSRTPSSNLGREGLHLVPASSTRTESLPRENERREGGIALIEGSILKAGKESLYDLAHNYQIQTTDSSCQFHLRWSYTISVKQVLGAPLHGGCCEGVNGDVIVHRKEGQASED